MEDMGNSPREETATPSYCHPFLGEKRDLELGKGDGVRLQRALNVKGRTECIWDLRVHLGGNPGSY